ncbi:hypothetical protein KY321_01215, partial [Candidatus Woesearchaeota archaeon]|nr:hypothetical protein [Candidatus Woesearchaeota archaeon]
MKINKILMIFVSFLLMFSLITLGLISVGLGKSALEKRINSDLDIIVSFNQNKIDDIISKNINSIESISFQKELIEGVVKDNSLGHDELVHNIEKDFFFKILKQQPGFLEFFILDKQGVVHLSTEKSNEGIFYG